MDHIDTASAALADRERPQVANHLRTIEAQTLDALLRIEEVINKYLVTMGEATVKMSYVQDEVQLEVIPPEGIKPTPTPFSEKITRENKNNSRKPRSL